MDCILLTPDPTRAKKKHLQAPNSEKRPRCSLKGTMRKHHLQPPTAASELEFAGRKSRSVSKRG